MNKNFLKYLFPPIFFDYSLLIWSFFKRLEYLPELRRNKCFENKYSGKECIILGTSPSIKNYDLRKIRKTNVFFLNNFYLHKDFKCVEKENNSFYLAAPIHPPQTEKDWERDFDKMLNSINSKTTIFFGLDGRKINIKRLLENSGIGSSKKNINYYFAGKYFSPYLKLEKKPKITGSLIRTYCASLYALQIAISLGFKRIYLLGIDHNYFLIRDSKNYRFYGQTENQKKEAKTNNSIDSIKNLYEVFSLYNQLNRLPNVKIVNLSKESLLTFLDFEKFEKVFK